MRINFKNLEMLKFISLIVTATLLIAQIPKDDENRDREVVISELPINTEFISKFTIVCDGKKFSFSLANKKNFDHSFSLEGSKSFKNENKTELKKINEFIKGRISVYVDGIRCYGRGFEVSISSANMEGESEVDYLKSYQFVDQ
jgi:hypothetical protein